MKPKSPDYTMKSCVRAEGHSHRPYWASAQVAVLLGSCLWKSTEALGRAADRPCHRPPAKEGWGSLQRWFLCLGPESIAPIQLAWLRVWWRPQGGEAPAEVDTAWCQGRLRTREAQATLWGPAVTCPLRLGSSPLSLSFPAVKRGAWTGDPRQSLCFGHPPSLMVLLQVTHSFRLWSFTQHTLTEHLSGPGTVLGAMGQ